jgi:hypothetical protein
MDLGKLESHAACDDVLLAARVDEEQILLAVIEEAEVGFRISLETGDATG